MVYSCKTGLLRMRYLGRTFYLDENMRKFNPLMYDIDK